MKAATSPRGELASQRVEVAERDAVAAGQQRPEPVAELLVAVQRERAERQAVEGVAGVEDPRAPGRRARELDRAPRRPRCRCSPAPSPRSAAGARATSCLGEQRPASTLTPSWGRLAAAGVEQLAQRGDHVGVVAPDREGAVAAQQVEVAVAVGVDQVRALAARPVAVEAERAHDPPELGVQVAVVERHRLAGAGGERSRRSSGAARGQVGGHSLQPTRAVETHDSAACYTYFSFVSR